MNVVINKNQEKQCTCGMLYVNKEVYADNIPPSKLTFTKKDEATNVSSLAFIK